MPERGKVFLLLFLQKKKILACLLLLACTPPAHAAPPDAARAAEQLRRAEGDRLARAAAAREAQARAEALRQQGTRLSAARQQATARLRAAEQATADSAERLLSLAQRRAAAEAQLRDRAADLQPLLPLMERLSLFPAETLLAVPAPPEQALAGLTVLRGLATEVERQARALREEQAAVAALDAQAQAEARRLAGARAEQAAQGAALDRQITATEGAQRDAAEGAAAATRAAAEDAARADSLRGLLASLEAQRRAAEQQAREAEARAARTRQEAARVAAARTAAALARPGPGLGPGPGLASGGAGRLIAPVAGQAVRGGGSEAGSSEGVSLLAGPGARVVAPCTGRVVFAQPFRSYGRLAILDCGGGWHVVLGGLERLDVPAGRAVSAGEPIGAMPDWDPQAPAATRPTLYVELRRGGQAVDPAPLLGSRG